MAASPNSGPVQYGVAGGVATITLNRPDKLNALNTEMYECLLEAFDRTDGDDTVRAVVVTGAGRAFCAGADLSAGARSFDYSESAGPEAHRDRGGMLVLRIFRSLKPVIAAINGPAVGVGATMTLPMDIRVLADTARVGFVFARRGIVPDGAASWFLPRVVGISQALEWCLTGRVFAAEEALAGGLVRSVCPAADVLPLAGLGGDHQALAVADARRGPPHGGAPDRLAGDLRHRPDGRRSRGGGRVPGEAGAVVDNGAEQGPAGLVPVAARAPVRRVSGGRPQLAG
jgi:enoyl-CoA hydratase/carnithine racemase